MAMVQPIGQAAHMPRAESVQSERKQASTTRRIRSVKVAVINCLMALMPRKMPSATNLEDTTK